MAHFAVYRTYVSREGWRPEDPELIRRAVRETLKENRGMRYEVRFIERYLLKAFDSDSSAAEREDAVGFVMRFQQLTGPLMAKAVEDTLFYVYNRFLPLNEVGGEPDRFAVTVDRFHDFNLRRMKTFPHSLSTSSTHDTKRGEDVRARLAVLSEIPREWKEQVRAWKRLNASRKKKVNDLPVPDSNDEYFLYQTLIGAYPFNREELADFTVRIKKHVVKAAREAKVHTDWLNPDAEYEAAFQSFVEEILQDGPDNPFLKSFLPLQRRVAHFGMINSLAQTLLKIVSPGVPDFYQGSELWDLRLVDPDNRGPVDFDSRLDLVAEMGRDSDSPARWIGEMMESREDGRLKLYLIQRALHARSDHGELFAHGDYIPLQGKGTFRRHLVSFARRKGSSWAVAIVPRLCVALEENGGDFPLGKQIWRDTAVALPKEAPLRWRDVFTGRSMDLHGRISVGQAFEEFPVALLLATEEEG